MGDTERLWLQTAALLHDVGKAVDKTDHHKRTRDVIIDSTELPFNRHERIIIGLTARYHRGGLPNRRHRYYGELDAGARRHVQSLAALLRIADGLDHQHQSLVTDMRCHVAEDNITLLPETTGPLSFRKAVAKADLLEKALGRRVQIIDRLNPLRLSSNSAQVHKLHHEP